MPTAATFTPIMGGFTIESDLLVAPFSLESGDGTPVPRSGLSTRQGQWRPGKLKTSFLLTTPDPTANDDGTFDLVVPVPFGDPDTDDVNTGVNAFWPIISVVAATVAAANQALSAFTSALDADANTLAIALAVGTPAAASCSWFITVDFGHTAVN